MQIEEQLEVETLDILTEEETSENPVAQLDGDEETEDGEEEEMEEGEEDGEEEESEEISEEKEG